VFGAPGALPTGDSALAPPVTLGDADLSRLRVTFGDLHVFRIWNLEKTPALLLGMDARSAAERRLGTTGPVACATGHMPDRLRA